MENTKGLEELAIDSATAEQRKDILQALNNVQASIERASRVILIPLIGHLTIYTLCRSKSYGFDNTTGYTYESQQEHPFLPSAYLSEKIIVFIIFLASLGVSKKLDPNKILEKIVAAVKFFSGKSKWFSKSVNLLSSDSKSFFKLLNFDFQAKNLSKQDAKEAAKNLDELHGALESGLATLTLMTFFLLGSMYLITLHNKNRMYSVFDLMGLSLVIAILLKNLISPLPRAAHSKTLKTLNEINATVFDSGNLSINSPIPNIVHSIFLSRKQTAICSFESKKIPFFTLHWSDELSKLGLKVISADKQQVIFLHDPLIEINKDIHKEIIKKLNFKRQQYSKCIANQDKLRKFLYDYNKSFAHTLIFDLDAVEMNWYYIPDKGPDAFLVIPFIVNTRKLTLEKINGFRSLSEETDQFNLFYEWRENSIIVKSIVNFDKIFFKKQLEQIDKENLSSSVKKSINCPMSFNENSLIHSLIENIHKRLPVKTYKIKAVKINSLPANRWNFTENKIVADAEKIEFTEVIYADFELEGNKYHVRAKNLNLLNVNGIQTNILIFFNQTAKQINDFKIKNNFAYQAL